jgi:hypothetical protein
MKHYTSFEDFINEAYDMNDPVLVAFRAARAKREKELAKPKRKPLYGKQRLKAEDDLWDISQDLKDLYADRGQLLIDMEEEAEAEGGPIADDYGDKLNKIEDEIQKLIAKRGQLEMRLAESKEAESVGEAYTDDDVNMLFGFYGQIETCFDEKKAKKLFDQGVLDLQKKYKLSEEAALTVLNSKMGRKAADQICDKQAKTAVEGLETYYTKSLQKEIDVVIKESLKIDELRLTSYGVKDLLKAVNNRLDLLPQLGFDKFKDVIHHLKYGDQEEQNELRDKLKELGVDVAYESKVNEGELNSKVAKKLTIGDTIKTDKHTYTITDFGQKANAFRQFQVEDEAGEIYQIQVSLYGSNRIGVGAGRSLNFRDEVLEALVTEAVSRDTKIYQIATPAPQSVLVRELEDLFGDDYRHIVTEFNDDEGYESVLVFNLTQRDIKRIQEEIGDVLIWEYSIKKGKEISESAVTESVFAFKTDNIEQLHFETDPKTAEEMKIELGKMQGEVSKIKQIESAEYSLRRFRKEIGYGNGKDVGVFLPGSYDASVSKLGDGPHKKAVKAVKWNQRKYDQWLEDMASNGGAENAFDMAQNAKNERGLIDWVRKQFRGEDPLQRIQWDIEAFVESVISEGISKDRMIKQIERALKDGTSIFKLPMDTQKYYHKNKSDFESLVTEAKTLDRDEMMDWLDQTLTFTRTSEEFDGSKGGIWTTGENGEQYKGKRIYDYYSEDYKNRTFGVLNSWEKELNKRGWYSEWYDAGTVMIWPN